MTRATSTLLVSSPISHFFIESIFFSRGLLNSLLFLFRGQVPTSVISTTQKPALGSFKKLIHKRINSALFSIFVVFHESKTKVIFAFLFINLLLQFFFDPDAGECLLFTVLEFLTISTVSHSIKEIYSFCSRKTLAVNPSATDRLFLCIHDFDDAYRHSCRAKIRNAKQVYLNVLLITKTERVLNCIYSSSHCSTCWLCMLFTTDYSFSKIFTFSKLFYFHSRATPHL